MVAQSLRRFLRYGLVVALLALVSLPGRAQDSLPPIDYDQWGRLAERAEQVIDAARASTPALEDLRAQIVVFRTQFAAVESANTARIASLREQLAILGPAPEALPEVAPPAETAPPTDEAAPVEDTEAAAPDVVPPPAPVLTAEPPEIAARRAELIDQLARAEAPRLRAQEAFRRANGLIGEIDVIIRDRQARELLELGPTPLSPLAWGETLVAVRGTALSIGAEIAAQADRATRAQSGADWAQTGLFLALALMLVLRGRFWVRQLSDWVARRFGDRRGEPVAAFFTSLGEVLVPWLGVNALAGALSSTGFFGPRGSFLVDLAPDFALTFLIARWLGGRVFSARQPLVDLGEARLREGRFYASMLGLVLALEGVVTPVIGFEGYAPGAAAVLQGALVVTGAVMLLRLGAMLRADVLSRRKPDAATELPDPAEPERGFRDTVQRAVAQLSILIGLGAPLAAAIGYAALADATIFPMLRSLGVLGILLILSRLTRQVYGALRDLTEERLQSALLPVLIDVVLLLVSLPVFALIWGARVSDLTELWTRFLGGITVGGAQISPANFLTFAVVFAALYAATRLSQGALRSAVLPKTKIDPGGQVAIISGLGYVGIFLAAIVAITAAGIDLSNLALVAGALSIGIGFGLQTIVSNFVAGIILLIERPVAEGDWIEVNGTMGIVRAISVRSTRIETFDRTDVIVPNADLISGMVTNWTRNNLTGRVIVPVGVAYGTDTRRVETILREIAEANPMVILNPPPLIVFKGFGADSLDFEIRAILRDVNWIVKVATELNHMIAERFAAEKIEIPFAQRDVWLRNPEVLQGPKPEAEA